MVVVAAIKIVVKVLVSLAAAVAAVVAAAAATVAEKAPIVERDRWERGGCCGR